jgi:hypothetical protein
MSRIFPGSYRSGRMKLLRRVGVMASSVALLAAMGVGLAAGPASAATFSGTLCIFVSPSQTTTVCVWSTPANEPITMAFGEASLVRLTGGGEYGPITFNNLCAQGFADRPYNGGWTVALESCRALSGQYWKVEAGPVTHGVQTDYIVNEYNPAYCLAWDQNAGTLFANTCRNAWYQQIYIRAAPTD